MGLKSGLGYRGSHAGGEGTVTIEMSRFGRGSV